jgi:hypothetical protein
MNHYPAHGIVLLLIAFVVLAFPVGASLNTIGAGDTVFIGEQGLNISGPLAGDTMIGWWSTTSSLSSAEPDYRMAIADPKNVYISPLEFSSRTGSWHSYPGRSLVFSVADPYIDIRIEDRTVNVDVTEKWAPWKDTLGFRIETNLYTISHRAGGSAGAPLTIKVLTPEGSILSSLVDSAGAAHPLDVRVTTNPFTTENIWDTGNSLYSAGTYVVWAECNENQMKDNYDQAGRTLSVQRSVLVQDQNPRISRIVPTPAPAMPMTTRMANTTIAKPTTMIPPTLPARETVQPLLTPSPSPAPTKAAGFCGWCTILAGTIASALFASGRR